jgi:hypothetical protein
MTTQENQQLKDLIQTKKLTNETNKSKYKTY